jgi:hypothetical protein
MPSGLTPNLRCMRNWFSAHHRKVYSGIATVVAVVVGLVWADWQSEPEVVPTTGYARGSLPVTWPNPGDHGVLSATVVGCLSRNRLGEFNRLRVNLRHGLPFLPLATSSCRQLDSGTAVTLIAIDGDYVALRAPGDMTPLWAYSNQVLKEFSTLPN